MAAKVIGAKLYGPKLDGVHIKEDLSQSSDEAFLAGNVIYGVMAAIVKAYPPQGDPGGPEPLNASRGGPAGAGIDFFLIWQLFQLYLALAVQAQTARVGDVIEAPHGVKVTNWGRRFNVTIKATCEAVLAAPPAGGEGASGDTKEPLK